MIHAAFRYCMLIFALGFLVGTARVIFGNQIIGEPASLGIELVIMLVASFFAARQGMALSGIHDLGRALLMGLLAFLMLMAIELGFAWLIFMQPPLQWLHGQISWPGWIGFSGQIGFGFMPLLVALVCKPGREPPEAAPTS